MRSSTSTPSRKTKKEGTLASFRLHSLTRSGAFHLWGSFTIRWPSSFNTQGARCRDAFYFKDVAHFKEGQLLSARSGLRSCTGQLRAPSQGCCRQGPLPPQPRPPPAPPELAKLPSTACWFPHVQPSPPHPPSFTVSHHTVPLKTKLTP